jgi:hypothetical protein
MLHRTVEQQTRRSVTAATARSGFAPLTATLTRKEATTILATEKPLLYIALYRVKISTEIRQNSTRLLWLDFDVVKPPIGCMLIHFSKSTSNKLPNRIFCFYI